MLPTYAHTWCVKYMALLPVLQGLPYVRLFPVRCRGNWLEEQFSSSDPEQCHDDQ